MLMFTEKEFAAFEVAGLDERMAVIRAQIQRLRILSRIRHVFCRTTSA